MKNFIRVIRLPNFSKLYFAGVSSELGSFITETALVLFIFQVSNENKNYLGILRATFLVFLTLGGIIGGPLAQQFSRKKILLVCELARIPAVLALIYFQSIYAVIIADAVIAFFTGIFKPSRQTLINETVPAEEIRNANGLFATSSALLHLMGPLLGAGLFAFFNGIKEILILDLLTYIAGYFLLKNIHYDGEESHQNSDGHFFRDLSQGIDFLRKKKDLMAIVGYSASAGLTVGLLIPLMLPFTLEILGKSELEFGYLMAFFGLGGAFGGALSMRISGKIGLGKICILSMLIEVVFFVLWTQLSHFFMAATLLFFWGLIVFLRISSQLNYISLTVPTEYLSRIHAVLEMSFIIPNITGSLIIGLVGDQYRTLDILYIASAVFLSFVFAQLFTKGSQVLWKSSPQGIERKVHI
jgi:MFS transporter, DHA3 family, macrolide efflux protein